MLSRRLTNPGNGLAATEPISEILWRWLRGKEGNSRGWMGNIPWPGPQRELQPQGRARRKLWLSPPPRGRQRPLHNLSWCSLCRDFLRNFRKSANNINKRPFWENKNRPTHFRPPCEDCGAWWPFWGPRGAPNRRSFWAAWGWGYRPGCGTCCLGSGSLAPPLPCHEPIE
jgi:hypothetical protein